MISASTASFAVARGDGGRFAQAYKRDRDTPVIGHSHLTVEVDVLAPTKRKRPTACLLGEQRRDPRKISRFFAQLRFLLAELLELGELLGHLRRIRCSGAAIAARDHPSRQRPHSDPKTSRHVRTAARRVVGTKPQVYGADKLWRAARRAGHDIGRDQVARLMRDLGICGVSRARKKVFTTRADPDAVRAPDLVNRNFTAEAPDQLWVTDLTYVPTRSGMAYVCFIVDAFSPRLVG